jgi:hypothetical protein
MYPGPNRFGGNSFNAVAVNDDSVTLRRPAIDERSYGNSGVSRFNALDAVTVGGESVSIFHGATGPRIQDAKEYLLKLTIHWVQINIPSSIRMHVQASLISSNKTTVTAITHRESRIGVKSKK